MRGRKDKMTDETEGEGTMGTFERAEAFVYRFARPLDLARWQYHFEGGSSGAVLKALACYQNEDGGFGHGLEADCWNPASAPIQTWAAAETLREVGITDPTHPMVRGILRYLAAGTDFDGHVWGNTVPGNNEYPHAPWWSWNAAADGPPNYNPTAYLAGFILRFADPHSELYERGSRVAQEAFDAYMKGGQPIGMHTAHCYIRLLEYCREAGVRGLLDLPALEARLQEQVEGDISRDTGSWQTEYVCRPSQYIDSPASIFYPRNRETAEYECDFIVRTQEGDGAWSLAWEWGGYPEEWAVSKHWWRASRALANLLYLKGFSRL